LSPSIEIEVINTRVPVYCDCGQDPEVPEHVYCSACEYDWHECQCSAADHPDVPWMMEWGVLRRQVEAATQEARS
jgi:hypothetical protein